MSVCANYWECDIRVNDTNFSDSSYARSMMLEPVPELIVVDGYLPWVWAMFGSLLVGLSGILPLLVMPTTIDHNSDFKQGAGANTLKTLLSFAVGAILGDVFLHSLPEIFLISVAKNGGEHGHPSIYSGLLILSGLIIFVAVEKFSTLAKPKEIEEIQPDAADGKKEKQPSKRITGYLNLVANTIDNFTHGLSLGGAFLVSFRTGCITTFAILFHEIPHEVGDFALLLGSGFDRSYAAKMQILTAGGGLIGAFIAINFSGASNTIEARTSWILPFTAGSFLHIALVSVLPDLLKEEDPKESVKQFLALILGILGVMVMSHVSFIVE